MNFFIGMPDYYNGDQEGENVRRGEGVQQTVQTEENRQKDGQSHAQNDLAGQGDDGGEQGLAQSLKIDEGALVHHGQDHHAQVDAEALDGKGGVISALVARAEDAEELPGEKLHDQRGYQAHNGLRGQQIAEQGLGPVLASGSGKSTLLRLMVGGYDAYEGSLTIDGQELRDTVPDSLYDLMSLVGQEVFIFDDTIRNNITMFAPFPAEQVDEAARQAGLDRVIRDRGEDYRCGENGVNLSGGERQRISIARALLRGSTVLLADEATAALDAETAKTVTDSILNLEGLTRVVVTHRLEPSALSRYDGIIVMKNGRVCEQGSFDGLMEAKNQFYALFMLANG